jgi:hypothetical protein
MQHSPAPAVLLVRKLESIGSLSSPECDALLRLEGTGMSVAAHRDVVRVGDRPGSVHFFVAGIGCRNVVLPDGKRQITSFHIPGDIPDLACLFVSTMDHNVSTLSLCGLLKIPHAAMYEGGGAMIPTGS